MQQQHFAQLSLESTFICPLIAHRGPAASNQQNPNGYQELPQDSIFAEMLNENEQKQERSWQSD